MRVALARTIATWFGCGLVPKGPGTAGSIGGLGVAYLLTTYAGWPLWWLIPLAVAFLPLAIWSATVTAETSKTKDPQFVVVDEVVGQWITLGAAGPHPNWKAWILAFLLFRLFDIWKPWPVRQLEALPSGTGIVADDCMAGVYGALVLAAAGWFNL